ncbi:hypothetical protein CVU76_01710 [Candidatus Dojkabacteria bacterium HGW-Dojkabacteria-1]|uniref:Methyltransferase FkbM domain-containing protein n=1 Tax=Candidatus Dojkabacteria bacterium HGW-Dojkabacteria-1 TaxID=2013761 RepID=A0A2N2F3F6_9BACT|nr:MAG: hypothetical protein CVU76_01710 [Candidatus Dojkabacteria bacterium HGW-Dojkabacteria-1]
MQETKLGKFSVVFPNSKEFHSLKKEIWGEDIYHFETEKESPVILDIGSHIGISVLYFKAIYPKSKIFAFEPNPISFKYLEENIYRNNLSNIKAFNKAVWKESTKRDLYVDGTQNEWNSNSSFLEKSWTGKEQTKKIIVDTTTLDEYLKYEVDMLKIDTEGCELTLIKANEHLLMNVNNISIEYHPIQNSKPEDILNILKKYFSIEIYYEGKYIKRLERGKLLTIKGKKLVNN